MINQTLSTFVLLAYQATGAPSLDAKPTLTATPPGAAGTAAASGTVPTTATDTAATGGGGGMQGMILIVALMLGGMMIFTAMGGRKERKKREQMLGSIKKHDRVLTAGGIVGSVVEFKDDTVILKVDEQTNTRITVTKAAISQVLAGTGAE